MSGSAADGERRSGIGAGNLPAGISIRNDLRPGDIGYITYLHGILYAREYGWDHTFEAYVAGPLSEFAKSHTHRERIWIVEKEGIVCGSIAIVEASDRVAQLRWLLLHPDLRGLGIGRMLVEESIAFSRANNYSSIILWTVGALTTAGALYHATGFRVAEEQAQDLWGATVNEQRYELTL